MSPFDGWWHFLIQKTILELNGGREFHLVGAGASHGLQFQMRQTSKKEKPACIQVTLLSNLTKYAPGQKAVMDDFAKKPKNKQSVNITVAEQTEVQILLEFCLEERCVYRPLCLVATHRANSPRSNETPEGWWWWWWWRNTECQRCISSTRQVSARRGVISILNELSL